jgi:ubiquinone/menaquinone biosynthesis C-methylase UbiE
MWKSLINCLPEDDTSQFNIESLTAKYHSLINNPSCVVDIGCGAGNSIDFFRSLMPKVQWIGVDIEGSPEVMSRTRGDGIFLNFDGINLPLPDKHADILFCKQVFEHVRYPEKLLMEMNRVLKDDGIVFGQTSHLEPYHSFQYWNFTPWGFKKIIEDSGFLMFQIRPGIDGLTLVRRTYEGRPATSKSIF